VVIRALNDPDLDPRRELVLPVGQDVHPVPVSFAGAVRERERRMDRLAVDVDMSAPGWLVLVEAWEPGWSAHVDGTPAPVLRANGLFRAVAVPVGRHRVDLTYQPPALRAGLALTTAAVVAGAAVAAWPRATAQVRWPERASA
jgi:uncharacterized membrane protein YfhO